MQTRYFPAMGATLSTLPGVRAPMFKTILFILGKQHFRSGTFPPCLAERRVGFVTLRVEGQFFANATFLIRKTTIPSPCAPAHAETSAWTSGAAKGAMRKTAVFPFGKHTFRATRPPCRSTVLQSRRFSIRNKHAFNNAWCVCMIAMSCLQRRGEHASDTWQVTGAAGSLYRRAAPVDRCCSPSCPPQPPARKHGRRSQRTGSMQTLLLPLGN